MNDLVYNLEKIAGRKRIKDRGIKWEEMYRERSIPLKEKFEKQVGPGAYHRWEGHDYTTNSIYYVVVGPSLQHNVGKVFFAGIKKIPIEEFTKDPDTKTYSPYGEYFPTIKGALIYASQRWGTPVPKGQVPYNRESLVNADIPEHVKA
jgi:hypothetical protein